MPLPPGEQSRAVAQLDAQLHALGTSAVCCVALKPPGERKALLLNTATGGTSSSTNGSTSGQGADWQEMDVDEWLQSLLINQVRADAGLHFGGADMHVHQTPLC